MTQVEVPQAIRHAQDAGIRVVIDHCACPDPARGLARNLFLLSRMIELAGVDGTATLPEIKRKFDEVAALTDRFV